MTYKDACMSGMVARPVISIKRLIGSIPKLRRPIEFHYSSLQALPSFPLFHTVTESWVEPGSDATTTVYTLCCFSFYSELFEIGGNPH